MVHYLPINFIYQLYNMNLPQNKSISGPINVVRLEGNIFGIKKVLYVYFDVHLPNEQETKCENVFLDTIQNYIIDQFKNGKIERLIFSWR